MIDGSWDAVLFALDGVVIYAAWYLYGCIQEHRPSKMEPYEQFVTRIGCVVLIGIMAVFGYLGAADFYVVLKSKEPLPMIFSPPMRAIVGRILIIGILLLGCWWHIRYHREEMNKMEI